MIRRISFAAMFAVVLVGMPVRSWAFPDWMGVYDHYLRHDGQNPGRFLILMNQSYVGLEANVGIRVNNGGWTEYPMSYVTDIDGNSMWEYVPSQPFPFGSTIEFYFHGYDSGGVDNIYDSRGASNYVSGALFWNIPEELPMFSVYPGNVLPATAYASSGEYLYQATAFISVNTNFAWSRRFAGKSWETITGPAEPVAVGEFAVAADGLRVALAYRLSTNIVVRRSSDGGYSWTENEMLASLPDGGSLSGFAAAAGPSGRLAFAYGVATNCCGAQRIFVVAETTPGGAWTSPSAAFQFDDLGVYASGMKMTGNAHGWYLAVRQVYQGSSFIMLGAASTDGMAWTTQRLGGDGNAWSEFDIAATTGKVVIAADPYYNTVTWTWQSAPGGLWTTQKIDRALESGSQIWLGTDGGSTWYLYRYEDNDSSPSTATYLPTYRVSVDNAASWSYPHPVKYSKPGSNDFATLKSVISAAGPVQRLVWQYSAYVNVFQRMYSAQLQSTSGFEESLDVEDLGTGQFRVAATNLTAGMSHALQYLAQPYGVTWTNLAAWNHGETSVVISAGADEQGIYRITSQY